MFLTLLLTSIGVAILGALVGLLKAYIIIRDEKNAPASEWKNRACVGPSRGSTQFEQNYMSVHNIEVADEPSVYFKRV